MKKELYFFFSSNCSDPIRSQMHHEDRMILYALVIYITVLLLVYVLFHIKENIQDNSIPKLNHKTMSNKQTLKMKDHIEKIYFRLLGYCRSKKIMKKRDLMDWEESYPD